MMNWRWWACLPIFCLLAPIALLGKGMEASAAMIDALFRPVAARLLRWVRHG